MVVGECSALRFLTQLGEMPAGEVVADDAVDESDLLGALRDENAELVFCHLQSLGRYGSCLGRAVAENLWVAEDDLESLLHRLVRRWLGSVIGLEPKRDTLDEGLEVVNRQCRDVAMDARARILGCVSMSILTTRS